MTFFEYLCQFRWARRTMIIVLLIPSLIVLVGEGLTQKKLAKTDWIRLELRKWKRFIVELWSKP